MEGMKSDDTAKEGVEHFPGVDALARVIGFMEGYTSPAGNWLTVDTLRVHATRVEREVENYVVGLRDRKVPIDELVEIQALCNKISKIKEAYVDACAQAERDGDVSHREGSDVVEAQLDSIGKILGNAYEEALKKSSPAEQ